MARRRRRKVRPHRPLRHVEFPLQILIAAAEPTAMGTLCLEPMVECHFCESNGGRSEGREKAQQHACLTEGRPPGLCAVGVRQERSRPPQRSAAHSVWKTSTLTSTTGARLWLWSARQRYDIARNCRAAEPAAGLAETPPIGVECALAAEAVRVDSPARRVAIRRVPSLLPAGVAGGSEEDAQAPLRSCAREAFP